MPPFPSAPMWEKKAGWAGRLTPNPPPAAAAGDVAPPAAAPPALLLLLGVPQRRRADAILGRRPPSVAALVGPRRVGPAGRRQGGAPPVPGAGRAAPPPRRHAGPLAHPRAASPRHGDGDGRRRGGGDLLRALPLRAPRGRRRLGVGQGGRRPAWARRRGLRIRAPRQPQPRRPPCTRARRHPLRRPHRLRRVFTWGYGGFGALGHYVCHRELLPRKVNGPWEGKIAHIATSGAHTAAITESGDGRLGLGSGGGPGEAGSLSVPSKVSALPVPVAVVACGGFFTLALTSDGQLWSWGANSNFELGRGSNSGDWRPQIVPSLKNVRVIQVACGGYHSLALTDEGEVLSWGHGGHGQLGHPTIQNHRVPLAIKALSEERIVYIACGGSTSAAISDKGDLYMWGNARDCQLGVPDLPEVQPLPVKVSFLADGDEDPSPPRVISITIGASHAMCLVSRQQIKK